jgi:hypothetical protein
MKKISSKKLSYHNVFFTVFFGILIFSVSSIVVYADSHLPVLTIATPQDNSYLSTNTVNFSGTASDDFTAKEALILKAFIDQDPIGIQVSINSEGSWLFSQSLTDGAHEVTFEIMDGDSNFQEKTLSITVDTARPFIDEIKIIPPGVTDENQFLPIEDMTQVPIDAKIFVSINDVSPLNNENVLSITTVGSPGVPIEIIEESRIKNINEGTWDIILMPKVPFSYKTSYFVYINSFISDSVGQFIFPKLFKFSTLSNDDPETTHGNYMANTQSCANCHSTHVATGKGLEGGKYGSLSTSNYCMACHDGTTNAPIIGEFKSHKHKQMGEKTDTCTSCHNPHLTWSKENPNRLKDHYVYNHQDVTIGLEDSDDQLCESCHEQDAAIVKNNTHYRPLFYKKSLTATGVSEDFTLCFQCHDGNKGQNIMEFYTVTELTTNSGHNIMATDGSPLNGQMPCADCHVTHGTDNIKGLKTKLGHAQREDAYTTTNTEWTAFDERQFCIKCHNNTTEMYGKKATLFAKDRSGKDIPEHSPADGTACSSCHGTGETFDQKSQSAAHAPKKLTTTSQ